MEIILISVVSGIGIMFTLIRCFGLRFVRRYNIFIDVFFCIGMPFLFSKSGAFEATAVAIISGIVMSLGLAFICWIVPANKN